VEEKEARDEEDDEPNRDNEDGEPTGGMEVEKPTRDEDDYKPAGHEAGYRTRWSTRRLCGELIEVSVFLVVCVVASQPEISPLSLT
jgi:hypothetical protein